MYPQRRLFWFRRLALAGALLAAAVVVLGAWVRLTDAGLGCPDWPGCYGHVYPNAGHADAQSGSQFAKALHEMIHRYFATTLGMVIVVLLVWAVRFRKDRDQPLLPVALLFIVVCLQGALGALTVTLLLKPLIVTAHLLGRPHHLGVVMVAVADPGDTADNPARGRAAQIRPSGACRSAPANRARRVDQHQLRRGGLSRFSHLPALLVAADGFSGRLRFVARDSESTYEGGVLANPARVAIHFTHRLGAMARAPY